MTEPAFILSDEELLELTGYSRPAEQMEWLEQANIPFKVKKGGRPSVVRYWAEHAPFADKPRSVINNPSPDVKTPRQIDKSLVGTGG